MTQNENKDELRRIFLELNSKNRQYALAVLRSLQYAQTKSSESEHEDEADATGKVAGE